MKLTGADIVVECLIEQGVETIFGYPGGAVLNIYDSLYKYSDRISHILTAHEQGASHAADGYSRSTGKTGVVLATSGPGATNLITGIATAYMDSIPMVAITGNVAKPLLGLDSFQEVDITGISMPITKHNFIVEDVNKLADIIRKAFYIANEGRKGPVLIDIPKDITAQYAEFSPKKVQEIRKCVFPALDEEIKEAIKLIKNSKRPYIYTGGGVISSNASKELEEFAKRLDAPVSTSLMGQGCFNQKDKRYIGMLGMHGTKTAAETITNCDLFIGIGTRFSDRVIGDPKTFARDAKIIQIDVDPAEIDKNIITTHSVIGDVADVLQKINSQLEQQNHSEWMQRVYEWKKQHNYPQRPFHKEDITPQYLMETLDELTDGGAIITTEVGQHQMWAAQFYEYKNPRSFVTSGGLGTMGFGLGASIGAKVGNPDKTVINIAGDGSFHMNLNELVTLSKNNINTIELVMNNNSLGMVRQWQRLFYDKRFSQTTLSRPTDYKKLGEAFGIDTFVIEKKSEVKDTLKKAIEISKGRPVLIECRINEDVNVLPMVPAGASVSNPILEIEID